MKERSYLKKRITLLGESNGSYYERTFTILKVISEGADGVTYEAFHEKSGKGVLKEFYPLDRVLLERDKEGILGHSKEMQGLFEQFRKQKRTFLKPYEMLLKIRQSSDDKDISSFIPSFELYYGRKTEEDRESTVYVWSPEPKIETFDRICDEIHRHPETRPEHKLVTVLKAVETLTKCVCALHSAGIIHRDIKPSNFGFINRRSETLTQAISMFDIDSLCSVWDKNIEFKGTTGYMEPEAGSEECNNQTDIFSIGAVLFSAIIINDETRNRGFIYDKSYFPRLKEMVDDSDLIQASELNSNPRLRNMLVTILQKCLCRRSLRYENCEALLADLQEAMFYALPAEITRKSRAGEKWVLIGADRILDAYSDRNAYLSILYHLYDHPLYETAEDDEALLKIVVAGFDNYGQRFLDACLHTGQMRGKKLDVRVIGADPVDRELYLTDRPELSSFFDIDGSLDRNDSYGSVMFVTGNVWTPENTPDDSIVLDAMSRLWQNEAADYAFISLGSDHDNRRIAADYRRKIKEKGSRCSVSYACGKTDVSVMPSAPVHPVMVNGKKPHKEIERMAFNTHLVWEKDLNLDSDIIRKDFRKRYNHDSCVSSVISLKYKMHELGIELGEASFSDAAKEFAEAVKRGGEQLENELIWLEHRRWVAEKLVLGWTRISDLQQCITGITKDEVSKKHVCIVSSRPDRKLAEYAAESSYGSDWRTIPDTIVEGLDDLDRLSVELHRVYAKKAEEILQTSPDDDHWLEIIRAEISHPKSVSAFNEWFSCIRSLWNEDSSKAKLFRGLEYAFLECVEENEPEKKQTIDQLVKGFESYFFPVTASVAPHDWKQEDAAFIENIPFILTYTEKSRLIIPLCTGKTADERFTNVSAATIIDPEKITYLYKAGDEEDPDALEQAVTAIISYMRNKRMKAELQLVIIRDDLHAEEMHPESLKKKLMEAGTGRIKAVDFENADDTATWAKGFIKTIQKRNKTAVAAVEKNSTELSLELESLGFYDSLPWYSFDSVKMLFAPCHGCDAFCYIKRRAAITVADMIGLGDAVMMNAERPQYYADHEELWLQYTGSKEAWDRFSCCLREYSVNNDILASIERSDRTGAAACAEYRFMIPAMCRDGASTVINGLIQNGLLENNSFIAGCHDGSCETVLYDSFGQRGKYEKVFSAVYALNVPEALSVRAREDGSGADIVFDGLMVKDLLPEEPVTEDVLQVLELLSGKGFLLAPESTDKGISFTYASGHIKHLLQHPEKIIEMHIYYSLKDRGEYDDIAIGDIGLTSGSREKYRCCLATKGFRTMAVDPEEDRTDKDAIEEIVKRACINAEIMAPQCLTHHNLTQ